MRASNHRPIPLTLRRDGFTMLELLIAIAVFGVLVAIAGPHVADMAEGVQLDGAAQQLLGDLERARTEAIKRNASVTLRRTSSTTYTITNVGTRSLSGATITSGDSVRFAPFGPPSTGAASFVVSAGGRTKTISVNAAGHARVQ